MTVKIKHELIAEAKSDTAQFSLRGRIGSGNINAATIAVMVADFLAKGVKKAHIFISSEGGSVFEMNDMISELEKFGAENVSIEVGAICASAATLPLTKFKAVARPNSQFMIHKPMVPTGGNEDEIEGALQLLKNITNDYRKAYALKMGVAEDVVEALWKRDKWLTAAEAMQMKLIDKITGTAVEIDAELSQLLVACGAPNTEITIKNKMEKEQLIASLGLAADATDQQIMDAIKDMKTKSEAHDKAEKEGAKGIKAKAEAVVMAAIAAKKILATQKDNYVAMYVAAPEATAAAIEALPEIGKLSAELNREKDINLEAARKDWTLEDYLDKDPEAYNKMRVEDPERASRLENDYFKSK